MARLRQAAIAVIPSQWDDPCPLSVIEALASGCAVVASSLGGIPELIADAGILLDSGDVAAWVEQLFQLANDVELRRSYQLAARSRAVQHLDIHRTSARLDAIRRAVMRGDGEFNP